MFDYTVNPLFPEREWEVAFGSITSAATGNAVAVDVSLVGVLSVNPVVDIETVRIRGGCFLIRRDSAIRAVSFEQESKLRLWQVTRKPPSACSRFNLTDTPKKR